MNHLKTKDRVLFGCNNLACRVSTFIPHASDQAEVRGHRRAVDYCPGCHRRGERLREAVPDAPRRPSDHDY